MRVHDEKPRRGMSPSDCFSITRNEEQEEPARITQLTNTMTEQPDLFAGITAMKSPRLRWMESNEITTERRVSSQGPIWIANRGKPESVISANGPTEDDALFDLAKKCNLRMWNEL